MSGMEVDGEGFGAEAEVGDGKLESLLEAIKSSEVLENRTALINQLEHSCSYSADDLCPILDSLTVSWDDARCSGVSHCMLHKSILQVALKCSQMDTTDYLGQFLPLGAKASSWCRRHFLWSVESIDESEEVQVEEHSRLLPEIVLMTLNITNKLLPSATKCISVDMVHTVGDFISEMLSLMESSIVDKKFHVAVPEFARAVPVFLDETVKLSKAYFEAAKANNCKGSIPEEEVAVEHIRPDITGDVMRITTSVIQNLFKLGIHAACSGGSQVTLLNASWKGAVSLLQIGKGMIEQKINIGDIILALISLSTKTLKVAAETWYKTSLETVGTSEARRAFLPIKFFLINAARICSVYPSEAMTIYKNIVRCTLVITSSSILFSKEPRLKAANESLVELLGPTSFVLIDTIMKSSEVTPESKCQLVNYFLENEEASNPGLMEQADQRNTALASLDCIFSTESDVDHKKRSLLPAEIIVVLHFLNTSSWLREEVLIEVSKKLQALLDIITSEDIYSYILGCQIPALYGADHSPVVVWQFVYTSLIQALKTFMISASTSSAAWSELEIFLLKNLFHPHFLCLEIITELWCFYVQYAEPGTSTYLINQLLLLLKSAASLESVLAPLCAFRKVARALCIILSYASSDTVDQIYTCLLDDEKSSKSSILHLGLLMEGFPFSSLSDGIKELAVKKMCTCFSGHLEGYFKNQRAINLPNSSWGVAGLPVHALASALQRCKIKADCIIDEKSITTIVKFTISIINTYGTSTDNTKYYLAKNISSMLDIISNTRHLCALNELEKLTLELHSLFLSTSDNQNAALSQCKPSMASFMAILGHLNVTEDEANVLCPAMWDLYHSLLRERHWALIHLAMDSFRYFAARTSFTQLWKFVPGDAALSYNASTGTSIDKNGFMLELRAYLQKEVALHSDRWSAGEQICFLVSEGRALKKLVEAYSEIPAVPEPEKAVITSDVCGKKRKLPDGLCEGMTLLQNGLKVMRSAFDEAESAVLKERLAAHLSRLEEAVSHIASFSEI